MKTEEILNQLVKKFDDDTIKLNERENHIIEVSTKIVVEVCQFLHNSPTFYFDSLSCITGTDNQNEENPYSIFYQLYSIPKNVHLTLKINIRDKAPSLTSIWAAADWQEREVYDLLGIEFENHPDLRRILLPNDWKGHPLQKDYKEDEKYHGVTIRY